MATGYFTDEGHEHLLGAVFKNDTEGAFYAALYNDTVIGTETIATIQNEQTGTGYAQAAITQDATGFPTLALDSSEMQIETKTVTFTASSTDWIAVTAICLCVDLATDKIIAYANLSTITVGNGDSIDFIFKLKLTK